MPSVAAIVLAAGASRRLGEPKQLVRLGTETLLERAVRTALEAGLNPLVAVLPPNLPIEPAPPGIIPVINHEAAQGMASSIGAGLRALPTDIPTVSGAVILACDQPSITPQHLRELALGGPNLVASAYSGRKGIPAYFPRSAFDALLALRGDVGARDLLAHARSIPLPGGELDVDTVQDLAHARKLYGS